MTKNKPSSLADTPPHLHKTWLAGQSVWLIDLERLPMGLGDALALLSTDERARADRLRLPQHRRAFVLARAAVRETVAPLLKIAPQDVTFTDGDHGKPALVTTPRLDLNWSRSGMRLAIITSRDGPVGIDVERAQTLDWRAMLDMVATDAERAAIEGGGHAAHGMFLTLWTTKEAMLKAIGKGFQGQPKQIDLPTDWLMGRTGGLKLRAMDRVFDLERMDWRGAVVTGAALFGPIIA